MQEWKKTVCSIESKAFSYFALIGSCDTISQQCTLGCTKKIIELCYIIVQFTRTRSKGSTSSATSRRGPWQSSIFVPLFIHFIKQNFWFTLVVHTCNNEFYVCTTTLHCIIWLYPIDRKSGQYNLIGLTASGAEPFLNNSFDATRRDISVRDTYLNCAISTTTIARGN